MSRVILAAVVYIGFFGSIIAGCVVTQSAWPLWALLLMPSFKTTREKDE